MDKYQTGCTPSYFKNLISRTGQSHNQPPRGTNFWRGANLPADFTLPQMGAPAVMLIQGATLARTGITN